MPIILYVPEDDEWVEPGPKEWRRHGSGKPPPRPDRPGHWHLYAGSHWLLKDSKKRVPSCWTQSQRAIRWAISYRNRYEVGPINKIQHELFAAVAPIPSESRSRLQEDVFRFATGHLTTTTHPLAPWDQLTQGPPTLNQVYMLRLAYAIFSEPGCYAELVPEFHPDAPPDPADDPMNDTILDESREFDPDED
ncbi:hypothetical protein FRC11_001023 [Ceratobasidium sp. 423]|nr:hypothetical protein FRC11_001023 [Ceratobasidium sp. 423]